MAETPRMIAWLERGQEPLLRDVLQNDDFILVAIGAHSPALGTELSDTFSVPRVDDLRQAILRDDVNVLFIAAPERIDADERRLLRERDILTVSAEPRPVDITDLMADATEAETAHFVPLMRRSSGYRGAIDALTEFGPPEAAHVALTGGVGQGTLFARVFDAMDLLHTSFSQIEGIDAALSGPISTVPESLEILHGNLTANIRFTDRRSASLCISDCAGPWRRQITFLSERGHITITDAGYHWHDADGELIEHAGADELHTPGQLIGMQITRLLEGRDAPPATSPPDTAMLLGWCEAARLSCRTGQPESPVRLLQIMSKL